MKAAERGGPVYFGNGNSVTVAERTPARQADISLPTSGAAVSSPETNRVLQLDGREGYVELPSNIFNDLEEATVEGWVRWDSLGSWMRFFDFGKQARTLLIGNNAETADLTLEIHDASGNAAG